jgi:Spy/CpxP family protein refolding chaperone
MKKLSKMKEEASQQEQEMQDLVEDLVQSDGFDQDTIDEKAEETAEKASEIMETYLGDEPDTQEASQLFYGIFIYNKF